MTFRNFEFFTGASCCRITDVPTTFVHSWVKASTPFYAFVDSADCRACYPGEQIVFPKETARPQVRQVLLRLLSEPEKSQLFDGPGLAGRRTGGKVLLSANTSWNLYKFRAGLIRAFCEHGYEVVAVAPTDAYSPHLENLGCRHVPVSIDNKGTSPFKDIGLFFNYLRLLRRERPDVYLGYTIKPNVYGSLAAHWLQVPAINNISGLGTTFIREGWLKRIVTVLYRTALRHSAIVYFQNSCDRNLFAEMKLVKSEQAALLPGSGIDLEYFRPEVSNEPNQGAPHFLLIARLLWTRA